MKIPWRKKDDFYIALLQHGKRNLERGLSSGDAKKYLIDEGYTFEEEYFPYLFSELFEEMLPKDMDVTPAAFRDEDAPQILTVDAYFHLLEHDELKQARTSSRNAMIVAIIAVTIGIAAALLDT